MIPQSLPYRCNAGRAREWISDGNNHYHLQDEQGLSIAQIWRGRNGWRWLTNNNRGGPAPDQWQARKAAEKDLEG